MKTPLNIKEPVPATPHDLRVITIDGPSASGKGTLARMIAEAFGWRFCDTGVFYRGLGLLCHIKQLNPTDLSYSHWQMLTRELTPTFLEMPELRVEPATSLSSQVGAIPEVRQALLDYQRNMALDLKESEWLVMDGRDIGTAIFPESPLKFYVTASVEVRAQRRYAELEKQDPGASLVDIETALRERDLRDSTRTASPLKPAADAIIIDTSAMTSGEVFQYVSQIITQNLKISLTN